jgi:hypothetical protein
MSFGRNPHVAKAEAAELKAQNAKDSAAHERAWREAGHLWERAAEREQDAKRRTLYNENAERARATADEPAPEPALDAVSDVLANELVAHEAEEPAAPSGTLN